MMLSTSRPLANAAFDRYMRHAMFDAWGDPTHRCEPVTDHWTQPYLARCSCGWFVWAPPEQDFDWADCTIRDVPGFAATLGTSV